MNTQTLPLLDRTNPTQTALDVFGMFEPFSYDYGINFAFGYAHFMYDQREDLGKPIVARDYFAAYSGMSI